MLRCLDEALLGLFEVDDIPDRLEVLYAGNGKYTMTAKGKRGTHVGLDVLVLQVERLRSVREMFALSRQGKRGYVRAPRCRCR